MRARRHTQAAERRGEMSSTDKPGAGREGEDDGATLEDVARDEREYVRERLRGELGREPSEDEVSEWLRRHTEGY